MLSARAESSIQSSEYTPLWAPSKSPLSRTVVYATLTACLGAVSFGFGMTYPSPVQEDLKDKLNWNGEKVSWFIVSLRFDLFTW